LRVKALFDELNHVRQEYSKVLFAKLSNARKETKELQELEENEIQQTKKGN
jgi:hypothetical protein